MEITDRKSSIDSTELIPSWYSPEELLSLAGDRDFILRKKMPGLFCQNLEDENSFLTNYLIDHSNRIDDVMQDKRAQLDAYLSSFHSEEKFREKIYNERVPEIFTPNQTYEQRQLFDYINKFWPLKQRASFPMEALLSSKKQRRDLHVCIDFIQILDRRFRMLVLWKRLHWLCLTSLSMVKQKIFVIY